MDSAHALNDGKPTVSYELFIEAGLPSIQWQTFKLSPNSWAVLFRLLWFCGVSNNSESLKETKQRALMASDKLVDLANKHQKILFVGHGIFNRFLAKELINRGWSGPNKPRTAYWSCDIYTL